MLKFNSIRSAVTIYNSAGAVVYKNANPGDEIKISADKIGGAGIYFVNVNSMVKKLVETNNWFYKLSFV
jgi:hypothetical protein